jgi:hypothetical protein
LSYQPPPHGIDPDRGLTMPELAAAISRMSPNRPTRAPTLLAWCRCGVGDVVLSSWMDAGDRLTTWRKYQVFLGKVAGRRSEIRRQKLKALGQPRVASGSKPASPKKGKAKGK